MGTYGTTNESFYGAERALREMMFCACAQYIRVHFHVGILLQPSSGAVPWVIGRVFLEKKAAEVSGQRMIVDVSRR
jgi:hypothetical protein